MLVITRKKHEKVIISDDIEITILEVGRNRVRFGIQAPKHITIHTRLKTSPPGTPPDNVRPIQVLEPAEPFPTLPAAVGMSNKR